MPANAALSSDFSSHLEPHRRALWHLSYRMTGSAADADDVVQDVFARALASPPENDRPLRPWLVRVALNRSRDLLRRRKARDYVGPWLPSPIDLENELPDLGASAEARYDLRESASFAFLIALEALSPSARAVLILRDVLDCSVKETADLLEMSEDNVKTTHHRARRKMEAYDHERRPIGGELRERTRRALERLFAAIGTGDAQTVAQVLTDDVRATTDGGGEFVAALKPVQTAPKVARFLTKLSQKGRLLDFEIRALNGLPAVVMTIEPSQPRAGRNLVVRVEIDASDQIREIHVVLSSEKLARVFG